MRASQAGVKQGMPIAEAASLLDRPPTLQPTDKEGDLLALQELVERFERFSPKISVENDLVAESLFLEIGGVVRIFGSEERLAQEVSNVAKELGYRAWIAVADCVGAAWAASRYLAQENEPALIRSGEREPLLALPIEALRLAEKTALAFRKLGVETIRQAAAIPRDAIKARFGEEILTRLDQLLARRPEPTQAVAPASEFFAKWSSEYPIRQGQELAAAIAALLDRLAGELRERDRGLVELLCTFVEEGGASFERGLRLCEPVASPRDLARLLALELERSPVRGAIGEIRLEAIETAKFLPRQRDLFASGSHRDPTKLGELLDRLGSRLGRENVVRPVLVDDPVPERSFLLVPVSARKPRRRKPPALPSPRQRPIRLLVEPKSIRVIATVPDGSPHVFSLSSKRHEILAAEGPERIEAAWWRGQTIRRDYWRVETTTGARFWVFRRLQDGAWFLHGYFA